MRLPLALLLPALLLGAGAHSNAQDQERKLIDRILRPDMSLEYTPEKGGFFGPKSFEATTARVKEFNLQQKFKPKDYLTGAYSGQKGYWKGDFKYSTTEADTSLKEIAKRQVEKEYATKEEEVKTARDAGKGYGITEYATKSTEFEGRSQHKMDTQGPQAMDSIRSGSFTQLKTIDDVRQLLNKNE